MTEWGYKSTHSLTSALDGGEWPASRTGHFVSGERAHGTHWVNPRASLDAVAKRKNPSPYRESSPGRPASSLVTKLTELTQLLYQI
jgi:hypothetical protein